MNSGRSKRVRPHEGLLLGEQMKGYEDETCSAIADLSRPCVIRLDGHCFHTFTRGFRRPYDERIHRAMVATATDLLERFGAATAYTESDEISLLFPPSQPDTPSLPFNGRVQKVVSVTAGYASARFNKHISAQSFEAPADAVLVERIMRSEAHFDARVFALTDEGTLIDYMRWRALMDCRRNSISMLAQAHFAPERLHAVEAQHVLRMLREEKGIEWEDEPAFFRFGTYVKKEQYLKEAFNPLKQVAVTATRTRPAARSFEFKPAQAAAYLLTRFWPGEGPGPGV
mmetsp:Transcript_10074/g.30898  ORF Transcript_10074/g.30898 Transcript_10074/m.30898 type:complete len:285 (-) Transcript_10074:966-1820(-)